MNGIRAKRLTKHSKSKRTNITLARLMLFSCGGEWSRLLCSRRSLLYIKDKFVLTLARRSRYLYLFNETSSSQKYISYKNHCDIRRINPTPPTTVSIYPFPILHPINIKYLHFNNIFAFCLQIKSESCYKKNKIHIKTRSGRFTALRDLSPRLSGY